MSTCAICSNPAGDNYVGKIRTCDACYAKWASAESNARLVVGMDKDLESDERLVACKTALEAARNALKSAQERLHQLEYGY